MSIDTGTAPAFVFCAALAPQFVSAEARAGAVGYSLLALEEHESVAVGVDDHEFLVATQVDRFA
jgi:hypothetical protein